MYTLESWVVGMMYSQFLIERVAIQYDVCILVCDHKVWQGVLSYMYMQ